MASNHNSYWERREEEALKHYLTEEVEYQKRIDDIYADMLDGCQSEIDRFYRKYADDEGISLTEAQKRISRLDIEAYERKAQRYVADAEADRRINGGKTNGRGYYFSTTANAEMKLYNATMKINRLEMLKANIGLELIKGTAELETFMGDILQGRTEDELKRQAGILGDTIRDNAKAAHSIVNASFHNATFSERLWGYHATMKADLSKLLQQGLIQGKGNRELARELQQYFVGDPKLKNGKKGAKYAAETLMRTELARVQTSAQKLSFERMGFDEYTFHANSGCCDDCQALNGKHFKVEKMMPGENAAPLHPRCRCSVSAYSDRKEYDEWLDFLSKGGATEEYNKLKATGKPLVPPKQKAATDISKIQNAASINELSAVMEEITGKKFSLAGADLELAKRNMKQLVSLGEKYGFRFSEVTTTAGRKYLGDVIRNGRYGEKVSMLFPKRFYKSRNSLLDELKKTASTGSMPRIGGRNIDIYTTTHEFAHTLSEKLCSTLYDRDTDFWDEIGDVYVDYKKNGGGVLGKYASQDENEFLAEAFAEAILGTNPSKWANDVLYVVDKYFKKKKKS